MAPVKMTRKRKSNQSTSSPEDQKIPTTKGSPQRSPIKKRRLGLSIAQKQALIENLQLEITERARRLRAQYNIQAQQLRSRVEMRINRIPTALRKAKMGELLSKSLQPQQPPRPPKSTYVAKPPSVPAKDGTSPKPIQRKPIPTTSAAAGRKRLSEEISGADKENLGSAVENPKKRIRGAATKGPASTQPGQILSPTTSNTRVVPRERPASPTKRVISRPPSPVKGPPPKASSNILSNMVEKAKGTRPAAGTRKATTSSTTSSNNGPTTTRTRQPAVPSRPPTAASTRGRRKVSATSEASDGSTATVVKKTTASRAAKTTAAPPAKRTVMSTIKSATTKKPPASKATAAPATGTGRTLRKRA
ncbi:Borealin N terminal-domain-containing protein [Hypoxylon trugodes]|uniref:Borealin N terminal-domain-containing protein n=1 Tax=Hypoxylon trugodes TaxID=326681 RepID=UPI0021999988|nr:Borealin N terminal-domain-containing protein [Hypoxylon trugodes]KAI1387079.1 Borealin N terminal-domain-containing protein [Hypoxylon trugodes]